MQTRKHPTTFASFLAVLLMTCASIAACAKEPPATHPYRFNYTTTLDSKGNLTVLDARGKPIPAKRIDGPLSAKKIVRVRTMSILEIEGSHYLAIIVDGVAYQIPLPD